MTKERLILDVKPEQLVLSKDGSVKVAFFDRLYEINKVVDDKGRTLRSDKEARLYIHVQIPADPKTVVERRAGERKVIDGEDVRFVPETELFSRAYEKYLVLKNQVVHDPYAEIEELKKKLAEKESVKTELKAEEIASLEAEPAKRGRPKKESD